MTNQPWPDGKAAAVSLTYDDGLPQHADVVARTLDARGLRATFYAPGWSDVSRRPDDWRRVAAAGHELGNHSVFHPCRRRPGAMWPAAWLDLTDYDLDRFRQELELGNRILTLVDGEAVRSYGNTCCETTVGPADAPTSIHPVVAELFAGARGRTTNRAAQPSENGFDICDVGTFEGDNRSLTDLEAIVAEAVECGGWSVIMFHGVGPAEHHLYIDPDIHDTFLAHLASRTDIWVAPFREVGAHVTP